MSVRKERYRWNLSALDRLLSPAIDIPDGSYKGEYLGIEFFLNPSAVEVLKQRVLVKEGGRLIESPEEMFARVAETAAELFWRRPENKTALRSMGFPDPDDKIFFWLMAKRIFLPNSPTLMNAGRREVGSFSACSVLSVGSTQQDLELAVQNMIRLHLFGMGVGFPLHTRPTRDVIKTLELLDSKTELGKASALHRGGNMGSLKVDHPDIKEFINAKVNTGRLTNFNLSVLITDDFLKAVESGENFPLVDPLSGKPVRKVSARELFDLIILRMWKNGEPGVIFYDQMQRQNRTPNTTSVLGELAPNVCGEQPLHPNETCNLGSINLEAIVDEDGKINISLLKGAVHAAVFFLNGIMVENTALPPIIMRTTLAQRKIGLGVMGWHGFLIKLGVPYDSDRAVKLAGKVMAIIEHEAVRASHALAEAGWGVFPTWKDSLWDTQYHLTVANATMTTIAPTGTLSIIADCSPGIEPILMVAGERRRTYGDVLVVDSLFRQLMERRGLWDDDLIKRIVENGGSVRGISKVPDDLQLLFPIATEVPPERQVTIQAAFQNNGVHNAVSKTVNLPPRATPEDVREIVLRARELNCVGITIYRAGTREAPADPASSRNSLCVECQTADGAVCEIPGGERVVIDDSF